TERSRGRTYADLSSTVVRGYTRLTDGWNFHQNRKSLPMSYSRVFPLALLLAWAGWFMVTVEAQQPAPPTKSSGTLPVPQPSPKTSPPTKPTAPPAPEPIKSDPEAQKILGDAINALETKPIQWFQAHLWQQLD